MAIYTKNFIDKAHRITLSRLEKWLIVFDPRQSKSKSGDVKYNNLKS